MVHLLTKGLVAFACVAPSLCSNPMKDKVAFITGASSGIGQVVADQLSQRGMKVVLTARRLEKLNANVETIKRAGGEAVAYQCDVSNGTSINEAFEFAKEKYGGVDFVFANAGVEGGLMTTALVDQDDSSISTMFDINVVGAVQTLKYAVKAFELRGGGTIAFSSSIAGFCGDVCNMAMIPAGLPRGHGIGYMASKAALDMVAEGAHGTYHDKGVNVYNLNIALFASEMGGRLGFEVEKPAPFNPIVKEKLGDPMHIAEALIAILDGTSQWPAGSAFMIDNDITVHAKYFYDKRKDAASIEYLGWRSPEELKKVAMDVKGQPYKFKQELCISDNITVTTGGGAEQAGAGQVYVTNTGYQQTQASYVSGSPGAAHRTELTTIPMAWPGTWQPVNMRSPAKLEPGTEAGAAKHWESATAAAYFRAPFP